MTSFLPPDVIKDAVNRLGESRAQPKLFDYLIFKRALELSGGSSSQVVTGMGNAQFQQAIREWALVRPTAAPGNHYFNPIGAARSKDNGYRNDKYPSNGPSDTVTRWATSISNPPFVAIPESTPRAFTFVAVPASDLERAFLLAESADPTLNRRPKLADVAMWWLRERDLETFGIDSTSEVSDLVDTLKSEVGLTNVEIGAIFDTTN
jgi:hypothetical protein